MCPVQRVNIGKSNCRQRKRTRTLSLSVFVNVAGVDAGDQRGALSAGVLGHVQHDPASAPALQKGKKENKGDISRFNRGKETDYLTPPAAKRLVFHGQKKGFPQRGEGGKGVESAPSTRSKGGNVRVRATMGHNGMAG